MQTPQRGDRLDIRAKDWGDMLTVMERFRTGEIKFNAPELSSSLGSQTRVKLLNEIGSPLDQCAVVGIGEPIITPGQNLQEFVSNFSFRATVPNSSRWGLMLEPCAADEIAIGILAGVGVCRIEVSDESHECADQDGNVMHLVSRFCGPAHILWKEPGTGLVWAVIRFGLSGPRWFVGTTSTPIPSGAMGMVMASGREFSVKNEASQTIGNAVKVGVSWDDLQNVYVVSMEFC